MGTPAEGLFPLRSPRWCVFVSGRGSNLAAVLEASSADVRLVVSSSSSAQALAKARRFGIPTLIAPRVTGPTGKRAIDWSVVTSELFRHSIDTVFLLGFMHVVPSDVVKDWEGRMLNIHPSILPSYAGLDSIARAFDAKDNCGATVHEVSTVVDAGRILSQKISVPASQLRQETFDSVEMRVHIDEQRMVKDTIEKWRAL